MEKASKWASMELCVALNLVTFSTCAASDVWTVEILS